MVDFPQRDKNIFGKKARFQIGQVTGQNLLCLQLFKFLFLSYWSNTGFIYVEKVK